MSTTATRPSRTPSAPSDAPAAGSTTSWTHAPRIEHLQPTAAILGHKDEAAAEADARRVPELPRPVARLADALDVRAVGGGEDGEAVVARVGDPNLGAVDREAARVVQLAGAVAALPNREHGLLAAVGGDGDDAALLLVGDKDAAVGRHRDAARVVERAARANLGDEAHLVVEELHAARAVGDVQPARRERDALRVSSPAARPRGADDAHDLARRRQRLQAVVGVVGDQEAAVGQRQRKVRVGEAAALAAPANAAHVLKVARALNGSAWLCAAPAASCAPPRRTPAAGGPRRCGRASNFFFNVARPRRTWIEGCSGSTASCAPRGSSRRGTSRAMDATRRGSEARLNSTSRHSFRLLLVIVQKAQPLPLHGLLGRARRRQDGRRPWRRGALRGWHLRAATTTALPRRRPPRRCLPRG